MRGIASSTVCWLALPCVLLVAGLVGLPLALLALSAARTGAGAQGLVELPAGTLIATLAWSCGGAVTCAIVGWLPGRLLRSAGPASRALVLACALLPAYGIFYCWWGFFRPGNPVADWAINNGWNVQLRQLVLLASLVSWGWPLCAWIVALAPSAEGRLIGTMLMIDGARKFDRFRVVWREDRASLGLAAGIMTLVLLGETTVFDAAQVSTLAAEVRALDASGLVAGQLVRDSLPGLAAAMLLALVVGAALVKALQARQQVAYGNLAELGSIRNAHRGRLGSWPLIAMCLVGSLLPMALLAWEVRHSGGWGAFASLHARASGNALAMAALCALLSSAVAVGGFALALARARLAMLVILQLSLLALAIPATLLALAHAQLWLSVEPLGGVYDSIVVIALVQAARFSPVALAAGFWCASGVARSDLEGWVVNGGSLKGFLQMARPALLCSAACGGLLAGSLCASETTLAARLAPPGIDWIATSLLNAIHYQDPVAVSAALPCIAVIALACAAAAQWSWSLLGRRMQSVFSRSPLIMLVLAILAVGCDSRSADLRGSTGASAGADLPAHREIGRTGFTEGRFQIPRVIAAEPGAGGALFVIDKSGRVQRFGRDGAFEKEWRMPKSDRGKPTGATIGPDGLLYVADTHEHRVAVFDRDGAVVRFVGTYGTGDGEFVYPSDIAFDTAGKMYVSEYGGNDRIQVFASGSGERVASIGSAGREPGQFARPQSMAVSPAGELFVVDACNHRIQVFALDGTLRRVMGSAGSAPGELAYPYSLALCADGSVLVVEFGNCRLQRLDGASGNSLGEWGGPGNATGRLNAPWAVELSAGTLFIVDSGNGRVKAIPEELLR